NLAGCQLLASKLATTSYRLVVAPASSQRTTSTAHSSVGQVLVTTNSTNTITTTNSNNHNNNNNSSSSSNNKGLENVSVADGNGGGATGTGTTYKVEVLEENDDIQSIATDDDDDDEDDDQDLISSDGSFYNEDEAAAATVADGLQPGHDDAVAQQLAAAGPVGVAAAAAIASSKKRKRSHMFETNPSVRKRQQNRLLRKLRGIIYEFTGRVGKQAVVLVATPGKPNTSYKVFGAKPLEDVLRNLKNIVMDELDNALAQQAPPPQQEDPTLFELPGLVIDGIPTPVEKMTQAQLRAFIPLMLKYSTGRGKPGWGRESTRPPWWPKELPWANVRMDARSEDDKQKISWTHALRKIVINCYKYHGRDDLLPTFADEDEKVTALVAQINYGVGAAVSSLNQNNHRDADADDDDDDDDDDADADENDLDDLEEQQQQQQQQQQIVSTRLATSGSSHTQQQQQHHQQQQQQVNVVKINSAGTVITTHHAQTNAPAPTIIQSTNNQHITTTATLPASTKIEICQAPAPGTQQQQQQQHQHHHQQQQQSAGATTIHIQPTGISQGQPQTIQLTTASGTATATATAITAGSVSAGTQTTTTAATLNNQQQLLNNHHHHHQQQQQQQQFTHNTHVCLEPLTLRHPCHDVDAVDDIVDQVDDDVDDVDFTTTQTVLSQNPDGSVSIIQVDPNNPIITLPDGTTAQVQGVATLHQGEGGTTTIQTVQSLSDVNGHENMTVDLTEAQDGQIYFTTEDGQDYPVSVSNVISVPVSMYQTVMANMQQLQTNSDGTVCLAPMQVQVASGNNINNNSHTTTAAAAALTSSGSNSSTGAITAPPALQCYQLITATSGAINRRPHQQQAITLQATTPAPTTTAASTVAATPRFYCLNYGQGQGTSTFNLNNNNNNNTNNNNATSATIKMPMPMPIVLANSTGTTANLRRRTTGTKRRRQKTTTPTALGRGTSAAVGAAAAVEAGTSAGASSSGGSSSSTAIRCVDSANLQTAKTIKLEHLEYLIKRNINRPSIYIENGDQMETITLTSDQMHQMMIQSGPGQEPQLVQVLSLKDGTLLGHQLKDHDDDETIIMEQ
ncbi:DNA-binding protein Ewg, partial [Drosophila willistoni]|uniref:DNA-binding protein Ewg n=1 Tax=Drosophila willistoni TaxID=7260 RepID=UPI001F083772